MLCGANGYLYHTSIFSGKDLGSDLKYQPFSTRLVNQMLQVAQANSNILIHEIYFDNFFTSYDFLSSLVERNKCAVGAIRENRTAAASKSMSSRKALSKKPHGSL